MNEKFTIIQKILIMIGLYILECFTRNKNFKNDDGNILDQMINR